MKNVFHRLPINTKVVFWSLSRSYSFGYVLPGGRVQFVHSHIDHAVAPDEIAVVPEWGARHGPPEPVSASGAARGGSLHFLDTFSDGKYLIHVKT